MRAHSACTANANTPPAFHVVECHDVAPWSSPLHGRAQLGCEFKYVAVGRVCTPRTYTLSCIESCATPACAQWHGIGVLHALRASCVLYSVAQGTRGRRLRGCAAASLYTCAKFPEIVQQALRHALAGCSRTPSMRSRWRAVCGSHCTARHVMLLGVQRIPIT